MIIAGLGEAEGDDEPTIITKLHNLLLAGATLGRKEGVMGDEEFLKYTSSGMLSMFQNLYSSVDVSKYMRFHTSIHRYFDLLLGLTQCQRNTEENKVRDTTVTTKSIYKARR